MIPERDIIKALADNRLRVSEAAQGLYLNRNSMHYRVDVIRRKTGLDPTHFWDMCELIKMYDIERDGETTPLGYMERQLTRCRMNYEREKARGAEKEVLQNIARKIGYYEAAVRSLCMLDD